MAQVRDRTRTTDAKRPRGGARIVLRDKAAASMTNRDSATVPLSKTRFERIADKPRPVGKVLAGYADTLARAGKEGRPVDMTFRVSPSGDVGPIVAKPIAIGPAADALDAAMLAAEARGRAKAKTILDGEDMLTARRFGPLIGASHETVNAKRKRFEILGLQGATRGVKYPRWQITDAGLLLPGLRQLFAILGDEPWTLYRFLRAAHAELGGRTAVDALKAGQIDAVVGVAESQAAGVFS